MSWIPLFGLLKRREEFLRKLGTYGERCAI
jgi:hypothetical protein